MGWIHLSQERVQEGNVLKMAVNVHVLQNAGEFVNWLSDCKLITNDRAP